ncbi:MAG TPA: hypothetical protein VNV15_09055 [Opitutaceae bacterium]|nr:hypothetical protein [Opitutaceae bacterium]
MNTKTELKDCLRRARSDVSLRKSLLHNARFLKKMFGWFALAWVLFLFGRIASEGWQWIPRDSGTAFSGLIFSVMCYDKFADRVAMLESMDLK